MNSSEIFLSLNKLNKLSSVLYIAAHPDDENTAALTYFSKHELVRTGYLSITRGDGGQNLIGTEQQDQLGIIRTNELLEARKIDGAEQFFTRAIDFGYSKSAEETFRKWNKEEILSDVVWVIRNFKPDIIITRFPSNGAGGHGHHTASAILAEEAFFAAADPKRFAEQLKHVDVWKAEKLFWNAWPSLLTEMKIDLTKIAQIDVGKYNPLLGRSYTEISSQSRSMHKSQGFGAISGREVNLNYFLRLDEPDDTSSLFFGIQNSWERVKGSEKISAMIDMIIDKYNFTEPEKSIADLAELWKLLSKSSSDNFFIRQKLLEVERLIKNCSGLWVEATSDKYEAVQGDILKVNLKTVNRSNLNIILKSAGVDYASPIEMNQNQLSPMQSFTNKIEINVSENIPVSQPFWLRKKRSAYLFNIDLIDIGRANSNNIFNAYFDVLISNIQFRFSVPVYYRWTDPINGEMFRDVEVLPTLSVEFEKNYLVFDPTEKQIVNVIVKNRGEKISGRLSLKSRNENLHLAENELSLMKDEQKNIPFELKHNSDLSDEIYAEFISEGGDIFNGKPERLSYSHFLPQPYIEPAQIKVLTYNKVKDNFRIAYLTGSGDEVPNILTELGYRVDIFSEDEILKINFHDYNCVITGIRFLNTSPQIKTFEPLLFNYVQNGGLLIYQYNTMQSLKTDKIGVYDLKIGRARVAEEDAEVRIFSSEHELLNFPNKITKEDFDGWIQERGLYFPESWSKEYQTILSMNDKNEKPLESAILIANYGNGKFIYTSLSFFRQLPAFVPGAIKIFQNMIHANGK